MAPQECGDNASVTLEALLSLPIHFPLQVQGVHGWDPLAMTW